MIKCNVSINYDRKAKYEIYIIAVLLNIFSGETKSTLICIRIIKEGHVV